MSEHCYAVKCVDCVNGDVSHYQYSTKKEAVDSVMTMDFRTDMDEKSRRDHFMNGKNPFCIEEHEGELYWQWAYLCYDDNKLLVPKGEKIPTSMNELRQYMESEKMIITCAQSRAKVGYQVIKAINSSSAEESPEETQ